jgi:hypothetical protein
MRRICLNKWLGDDIQTSEPMDLAWRLLKWQQESDDDFVCPTCGFRTHDEEVFAYHDCLPTDVGGLNLAAIRDALNAKYQEENQ